MLGDGLRSGVSPFFSPHATPIDRRLPPETMLSLLILNEDGSLNIDNRTNVHFRNNQKTEWDGSYYSITPDVVAIAVAADAMVDVIIVDVE
jgi:hypothetical protein